MRFRNLRCSVFIVVLMFWLAILSGCKTKSAELIVGSKAPIFEAVDHNGQIWKSKDFIGKKNLIVYFYPAAMTGG